MSDKTTGLDPKVIDPTKRTIEAMALELDRVNAENAALKAALTAQPVPQAAGGFDLKPDEIKKLITTLGAMQIQEKRGMWQPWWGKFYKQAEAILSARLPSEPVSVPAINTKQLKQDMWATFNGCENITRTEKRAIIFAVDYLSAHKLLKAEPVLSEQAALEAIREQFENWLTGEGEWPHLKYKNFGGSYITDEACMKWDAYRAGVKAALQNAAK